MRPTASFSATKENAVWCKNQHIITQRTPSLQWNMVAAASCCGDVSQQQGLGKWSKSRGSWMVLNTGVFLTKTCFRWSMIWDWDRGSPSNRTMTPSMQLKQHDWFKVKRVHVLEQPSQIPDLNPTEPLRSDLKIAAHQREPSNLKALEQFWLVEWTKIPVTRYGKLMTLIQSDAPERWLSTQYWV